MDNLIKRNDYCFSFNTLSRGTKSVKQKMSLSIPNPTCVVAWDYTIEVQVSLHCYFSSVLSSQVQTRTHNSNNTFFISIYIYINHVIIVIFLSTNNCFFHELHLVMFESVSTSDSSPRLWFIQFDIFFRQHKVNITNNAVHNGVFFV